jgi:beta-lactamase regulating signal transducer with metallopeptidase domain
VTVADASLTAKDVLGTLGMMALQGSVLVALALVIARGRRISPAWQAGVWLVVMAKFTLPWAPAMPWSLADLIASLRGEGAVTALAVTQPAQPAPVVASTPWIGWLVLAVIWAAGAAIVLLRANAVERHAIALARNAAPAPAEARALLDSLGGRWVRLVVGDAAIGPYVIGVVAPIIVVPPALLSNDQLLRAALLHELAHVRRLDALGRFVQVLARAAFWWFPIVALASRRLDHAREAACDARALEVGEISRPAYARLLLQMAQLRTAPASSLAAPAALEPRIASVLGPPMRSRLGLVHVVALLVWIPVALGGARSAEARGVETCVYTTQLAEALRQAHPEADADRDGVLSHDEACEFQAEIRRTTTASGPVTPIDEATAGLLAEPLCCNCQTSEGPVSSGATCSPE